MYEHQMCINYFEEKKKLGHMLVNGVKGNEIAFMCNFHC